MAGGAGLDALSNSRFDGHLHGVARPSLTALSSTPGRGRPHTFRSDPRPSSHCLVVFHVLMGRKQEPEGQGFLSPKDKHRNGMEVEGEWGYCWLNDGARR